MAKRYYRVGEFIWIKELKRKGKVKELFIAELNATVEYFDDNGNKQSKKLTFMEIDKLRKGEEVSKSGTKRKDTLLMAKTHPDARLLSKRYEDGCYDVYACFDEDEMWLYKGQENLVPTGIAVSMLPKYRLNLARERGSTGVVGMEVLSGQVDSGYRGEIFVNIAPDFYHILISKNVSATTYHMADGRIVVDRNDLPLKHFDELVGDGISYVKYPYNKAICQAALEFVPDVSEKEISFEDLKKIPSERGDGKIGSSGK